MEHKYTNTDCKLHGTRYCALLHMESCASCTVAAASPEQAEGLAKNLDVTASLMPENGVACLFESEECLLCKGARGKREWYADVDIGNVEPKTESRNVLGMKSIARTGSMVPLQIACCKDCRKRLLMIEYLPTVAATAISLIALIVMSIRPVRESLMGRHEILPLLIFASVVLLALLLSAVLRKKLVADAEGKTELRALDLVQLAGMREKGWFEINPGKKGMTRFVFARKRIRQGLYTGGAEKTSQNSEKSI